jgi:2-polyprenyl-6-hydroxyphenyl methylase/3-demethylubiquinone-9 3-methyltransferase
MATPTPQACKCCGAPAPWFGAADFAKTCEDRHGAPPFPPAGWSVDYHRCGDCGFLFSRFLDDWPQERVQREIYNDDYAKADPDLAAARPEEQANGIERLFGHARAQLRVLDFGGGTGELARRLRARGFARVDSIDPFHGVNQVRLSRVDLMLCFEVIEHLPNPALPFEAAAAVLKDDAAMFFSTLVQPDDIETQGAAWWYLAPRNGHISLHTRQSLTALTQRHGLSLGSFNDAFHLAWRGAPAFAASLLPR